MSEEGKEEIYPLKSLHNFLYELNAEWDRFRTASVIGIVTSAVLLIFIAYRFMAILFWMRRFGLRFMEMIDNIVFLILVTGFVIYEIYLLYRQYRFFRRWERRMGLLIHLEESILEGREKEQS